VSPAFAQQARERPDREVALALERWRKPGRADRLGALNRLVHLSSRAAPVVPELIRGLQDRDPVIRAKTALLMGQIGPAATAANPTLLIASRDPEPKVRAAVITALSQTRPEPAAAIPVLVQLLRTDHSDDEHRGLLQALVGLKGASVPALIDSLSKSTGESQAIVAESFVQLGELAEPAVAPLIAALGSTRGDIRDRISTSLAQLCSERPEPVIRALGDGSPSVRAGAARALQMLGAAAESAVPALIAALERDEPPAPPDLSKIPGSNVWMIDEQLEPPGPWTALGVIGRPAVPALLKLLDQPDRVTRIRALRTIAFLRSGGRPVARRLIGLLGRPELRLEAIATLRRIRPPARAALPMLGLLLKNRDPEVRAAAAWAVGSIGRASMATSGGRKVLSAEIVAGLAATLRDPEPPVRRAAAMALGGIAPGATEAIPAMVAYLTQADRDNRVTVLETLGRVGKLPDPAQSAIARLFRDPDRQVRIAAATGVAAENALSGDMIEALLSALTDADARVRAPAAGRLAQSHGQIGYWTDGESFYRGAENSGPLEANARVLSALRAALDDPDRRVRAAVVHLLPVFRKNAAEVVPLLAGRLEDPACYVGANAAIALGELGQAARPALGALERVLKEAQGRGPNGNNLIINAAQAMAAIDPKSKSRAINILTLRLCEARPEAFEPAQNALWGLGLDPCTELVRVLAERPASAQARGRLAEVLQRMLMSGLDTAIVEPRLVEVRTAEPALRELADDEDDDAAACALRLLDFLQPRGPSEAQRVLDDVAERGVKPWLVDLGRLTPAPPEIEVLIKALKSPRNEVRIVAILGLAQAGRNLPQEARFGDMNEKEAAADEEAADRDPPIRAQILDALVPLLSDPDPEVRGTAIQAVAIVASGEPSRPARIVPALVAALADKTSRCSNLESVPNGEIGSDPADLRDAASVPLRIVAMIALGSLGEGASTAVPPLIEAVRGDDLIVRWFAVQTLGMIGHKAGAAVPDLIQMLESEDPAPDAPLATGLAAGSLTAAQFRTKAAIVLGQIGPQARAAVPALIRSMNSERGDVAVYAINALGEIGSSSPEVIPALGSVLTQSLKPNQAETAASSLANVGEPALPALQAALRNRDPDVQLIAATTLGNMAEKATAVIPSLIQAQADPDPDVAEAATQAIAQIRGAEKDAATKPVENAVDDPPSP
jgi:HEAT repeat protein